VQRAWRDLGSFALFQDIGDVFATVGLESQRVMERAVDLFQAIDFAQGDDLLDVMPAVEALVLQFASVSLGVGAEGQEGQQ